MRLIDADALLQRAIPHGWSTPKWVSDIAIEDAPTIDAVPVKHGEWITKGQDIYCSACGGESAYTWHGSSKFSAYCPNCGAEMRVRTDMTNADRIRAMTDDELAEQLYLLRLDALRLEGYEGFIETKEEILDWLKEEEDDATND